MWVPGAKSSGFPSGDWGMHQNVHLQLIMTVNERTFPLSLFSSHPSPAGIELETQEHIEFSPCRQLFLGWTLSASLS